MTPQMFALLLYHLIRSERKNDRVCGDLWEAEWGDLEPELWFREELDGASVVVFKDFGHGRLRVTVTEEPEA